MDHNTIAINPIIDENEIIYIEHAKILDEDKYFFSYINKNIKTIKDILLFILLVVGFIIFVDKLGNFSTVNSSDDSP